LPPGVPPLSKLRSSLLWVLAAAVMLGAAAQVRWMVDVTEDRRNSFPAADQRLLGTLRLPLLVIVHLAPEDPRFADLERNVLAKLERAMPNVSAALAGGRQGFSTGTGDESYGEVEYVYGNRSDISRSTSPREILPLLYALAGVSPPAPTPGSEYPGYPLVASADAALFWFFGGLPLLIVLCWWWIRRPPSIDSPLVHGGGSS
jgi:ABC-2 type transport system permease protein